MHGTSDFDVRLERLPDGPIVVRVAGELDMATAPRLQETVAPALSAPRLVLDLSACTFLDSTGVRLLTSTAREMQAAGGTVALVVTDAGVRRVLEITSADTLVSVHSTLEAAL